MSHLGTLLDLADGARLTGIGVLPSAGDTKAIDGRIHARTVVSLGDEDAGAAGSAVSAFMEASLAFIHGLQDDGSSWFTVFQYAPEHLDEASSSRAASAAIERALGLTRIPDDGLTGFDLSTDEIREAYPADADVQEWPIVDLLMGLLVDLATERLDEVVAEAQAPGLTGDALAMHREQVIGAALMRWSATYSGPHL